MHPITENLQKISSHIHDTIKLIAVSKLKPIEDIEVAYQSGHRYFGENKAIEMKTKSEALPNDIEWHFIGHLQRNKVKYIVPFVHLIHSVDSIKLLQEINRQGLKNNRIIDCLLQFYIATEETKFGFSPDEAAELLESEDFPLMKNVRICGVMGMATYTENKALIRQEFKTLYTYFSELKKKYFFNAQHFKEISMGMTNDYDLAIEEGSTIVRIGSAIFGERNYVTT